MSHPDPSHNPENERVEDNPRSPVRKVKTPVEKSLARKRKKIAMSMRGLHPGWSMKYRK